MADNAPAAAPAAVPAGHRVDEWRELVEKKLLEMFGGEAPVLECIKKLLRDTGSLIAGGGILHAIQPFPDNIASSKDIDIYVPASQIPTFIERIRADDCMGSKYVKQIEASLYCKSFLRKNGIRKIYTLTTKIKHLYIDIMSVRNKRTPLAVVNNFDLTFCQVWYDGEAVYASHPDHIREKKGFMSAEYIPTFLAGNRFLARRIRKYLERGFTVLPDPASPGLDDIFQRLPDHIKFADSKNKYNELTIEQLRSWMAHILLKLAKRAPEDKMNSIYRFDPENHYPILPGYASYNTRPKRPDFLFTKNLHDGLEYGDAYYSQVYSIPTFPGFDLTMRRANEVRHVINEIRADGYDSEDLINERADLHNDENHEDYIKDDIIKADIIGKYYRDSPDDLVFIMEGNVRRPNPSDDLKYHRAMTRILIHSIGVDYTKQKYRKDNASTFRHIISELKRGADIHYKVSLEKNKKYVDAMKLFMTRYGEDMFANEGQLFDIHNHPENGAITQEGLEAYCETHIADIDKTEVPCYWQPEPGDSPKNCKHKLKLEEVRAIVSDEFYERYSKPAPIKAGLNQIVSAYDIVFSNKRTPDPLRFGDLYGKTVCPFCLQLENRDEGCAYITHSNPRRLGNEHTPFCEPHFITPLLDKYRKRARVLFPGVPDEALHIEFCVECGRPCAGHQHFDLNEPAGLVPIPMKPNPANPAQQIQDYGRCPGGGRPELYARILAIREIYANLDINVPADERAAAAAAAEGAARDPAYIARGRAIFEKAEAERKWNVNVPARKNYNNNAYRAAPGNEADEKENEDNLPPLGNVAPGAAGAEAGAAPAAGAGNQAGGKHRRTYKKRKGSKSKFTRKMN